MGWAGDIANECPAVAFATPTVRTVTQVVYANENWATTIQGTGVEYPSIREWSLRSGHWFTQQDVDAAAKVAVLGATVAEMLFGSVDPVGQVMQIKNMPFRVVGLLTAKGQSTMGQDQDDIIFMPYTTSQKELIGVTYIRAILASAVSSGLMGQALDQITALLPSVIACLPGKKMIFRYDRSPTWRLPKRKARAS
jgi:putative ABC transport system permease protein